MLLPHKAECYENVYEVIVMSHSNKTMAHTSTAIKTGRRSKHLTCQNSTQSTVMIHTVPCQLWPAGPILSMLS